MATAVDTVVEIAGRRPERRPRAARQPSCTARAGTRRRRCGCSATTSTPRWPRIPTRLVVYGGSGRAARSHEALQGDRGRAARARVRRDAARAERQAGRRLPHPPRRAARADRQLAARAPVRDLGRVPPARGRGADDVRPDDRRVVDLHRHPGDPAGHVPDLRRRRRAALGLARPGRPHRAHRRPRRDGRRPAAGRLARRRRQPERRGRPAPDRAPDRDPLPGRGGRRPRRRASRGSAPTPPPAAASRSACSETPPTSSPRWPGAACTSTSSPTRRRPTTC